MVYLLQGSCWNTEKTLLDGFGRVFSERIASTNRSVADCVCSGMCSASLLSTIPSSVGQLDATGLANHYMDDATKRIDVAISGHTRSEFAVFPGDAPSSIAGIHLHYCLKPLTKNKNVLLFSYEQINSTNRWRCCWVRCYWLHFLASEFFLQDWIHISLKRAIFSISF